MTGNQQFASVAESGPLERRRGNRFCLRLRCRLRPVSTRELALAGTVIDISRSGILVELDSAQFHGRLSPHDGVRVIVELPRNPAFSPRCLECAATVVRIVAAGARTRVAVEIRTIRVTDQHQGGASASDWRSAPIEGLVQ